MKLLVLHLSDIHLKTADDPVLARGGRIVDAVRGLQYDLDLCVLAVSGDIAYSGTEEQYADSAAFLGKIRDRLRDELRPKSPVEVVLIPGNHDCDFRGGGEVREILIGKVTTSEEVSVAGDVGRVCAEVQQQFFDFRDTLAAMGLEGDDSLYWEYHFDLGAERILFRCCNTAWISRFKEQHGQMYFPVDRLRDQSGKATLAITMFHHPYNWLTPNNGRAFRRRVEEVSDVILTGHEHDATLRTQRGARGEVNIYLEGGALQENHDPSQSAFNVILVDTITKRQKVYHFGWEGTLYAASPADPSWEEYQVNRLRSAGELELTEAMDIFLCDLGISITHPARGLLSLPDICVYPDLKEVVYRPRAVSHAARGEGLVALVSRLERLLITAADKAGKTTLAKQLYTDYLASGFIPVFLDGSRGKFHDDDRAITGFGEAFKEQYRGMPVEQYRQLDRSRRVLIVDNFDRIRLRKGSLRGALNQMVHFAGHVILLANDVAQQVAEMVGNAPVTEGGAAFTQYRIQPFGHVRRNELIERWFALDDAAGENQDELARRILQAKQIMDTAIGRNFVPSYPVMLLPILQALQHNEQINTNASTYGYFYELLIRRTLAQGSTSVALDVKLGYLTFLAQSMFVGGKDRLTEQELREVHVAYEKHHLLPVSFRDLIDSLTRSQVLEEREGEYSFKYSYTYYYFVASYLRDNLTEPTVERIVADLARRLHQEDSANILLFLAHLSKDRLIIEQMMRTATLLFADVPRAELRPEGSPLLAVEEQSPAIYTEHDSREHRRAVLAEIDQYEEKVQERRKGGIRDERSDTALVATQNDETREEIDRELAEANSYMQQMGVAFRTLQILGQLLKNFVGTMDGKTKRLLADECVGLGLRTLGSLFGLVEQRGQEYIESMIETLREADSDTTDRDLVEKAKESLGGLVTLASYGMVKRISHAIGSPHLGQVYNLLVEEDNAPTVRLVHTSLHLDQFSSFPEVQIRELYEELEGNPLAVQVLRSLVMSHFHIFDLRFDLKQRVCAAIGVIYRPSIGSNQRARLISG